MKITKFEQSCLLVEMPAPINRTALFDPGMMSEASLNVDSLEFLDDIVITHSHGDHMSPGLVKKLIDKFPNVHITGSRDVSQALAATTNNVTSSESDGIKFFSAPHESVEPLFPLPEQIGVHYLNLLTHPGDSHSFTETQQVLALPVTAPWGSMVKAVNLGLQLKPRYILPIHDWHWSDAAREQSYQLMKQVFADNGITFVILKTGEPVVLEI